MTNQQISDLGAAGVPQDAIDASPSCNQASPARSSPPTSPSTSSCLSREAGFTPVGMVLGSSIYHVGIQVGRWGENEELDVLSQAMYHARELAMSRMEQEANVLGADGIVGVRLEVEFKELARTSRSSSPSALR